jgi:hypothetical protein
MIKEHTVDEGTTTGYLMADLVNKLMRNCPVEIKVIRSMGTVKKVLNETTVRYRLFKKI